MREHIDFIQTQHLPWESASSDGLPHGSQVKVLSHDPATGESSLLVRLPARSTVQRDPDRDLEFLVLEGTIAGESDVFARYDYGFHAAGQRASLSILDAPALALLFTSPVRALKNQSPEWVAKRRTPKRDLHAGIWDGDFDRFNLGSMKDGARMRVLREDPLTGETTYLTATIAFRRGSQAERHPISQEFFLLSGELAGDRGIMQAGAYCIRPPMAKHGPYGSPTGALIFFRGLGGPQHTEWEPAPPFGFDPPHAPILPERLLPYGQPLPRQQVY